MADVVTRGTSPLLMEETSRSSEQDGSLSESGFRWNFKTTTLLIQLRLDIEEEFQHPICRKLLLWQRIAKQMLEIGGFEVSGIACDCKWRSLVSTYRKIKERLKKSGGSSQIAWEYFYFLDETFSPKTTKESSNETPDGKSDKDESQDYPALSQQSPLPASNSEVPSTNSFFPPEPSISSEPMDTSLIPQQHINSSASSTSFVVVVNNKKIPDNLANERVVTISPPPSHYKFSQKKKSGEEPPDWFLEYMEHHKSEEELKWKEWKEIENKKLEAVNKLINLLDSVVNKSKF